MRTLMRWILSYVFVIQMYVMMAVIGLLFMPLSAIDRRFAFTAIHAFCNWVRITARLLCGLRSEIRGTIPEGEVIIASKHQSFFDIILICSVVRRPKFIMKQQLMRAPILNWYAVRTGCVPVDRGKRGAAIQKMVKDVAANRAGPGQLIIYPQGTRTAPGADLPYKIGTGVLYRALGQTCVPAATNVGLFWPRRGMYRKPGLAVVEFLPPIAPGLDPHTFMAQLKDTVETASNALMAEAGFGGPSGVD